MVPLPAGLEAADMPADAIEVGRIADAWGVKGWFKVLPHSASPEALFSSKRWYLLPNERGPKTFADTVLLRVREAKEHSGAVVAVAQEIEDRAAAEAPCARERPVVRPGPRVTLAEGEHSGKP